MIKILISGDFCPINRTSQLAKAGDYSSIFNDFISVLKDNDLNITNLECPLYNGVQAIKKMGPSLKVDVSIASILSYGNFHLATLANNHSMDFGVEGLKSTIDACKIENVATIGAGMNLSEARVPLFKTIKGKIIAVLNFSENEFSTSQDNKPGANPLNPISNYYDIIEARKKADFVFVIVHGGHEYYQLPSPRMQSTYRFFIDAGADAVIGHHTHCYSGYEIYKGKSIFYSLGNFIFDWPDKFDSVWNKGYAVQFTITNDHITFALNPFIQGDQKPGVRLMNEPEKIAFKANLEMLNLQINDSRKLSMQFQEYMKSQKKDYLSYFEPYSNWFLVGLYNRGLLPSSISLKKKRTLLNIIRCEAHRDLL